MGNLAPPVVWMDVGARVMAIPAPAAPVEPHVIVNPDARATVGDAIIPAVVADIAHAPAADKLSGCDRRKSQ
jgi:hypothetical protein